MLPLTRRRWSTPIALGAAVLLATAACTSTGGSTTASAPDVAIKPGDDHAATTVTVWSFTHLPNEVKAFQTAADRLHTRYPWLTVTLVQNKDDADFTKAVAAGAPPDVFVSNSPDSVAKFCQNKTVADMNPYLKAAGIDAAKTFPAGNYQYMRYQGKQCALPLLTDAFGLYYNKAMFKAAGITTPPKTLDELRADAEKLTIKKPDGTISQWGFVPAEAYNVNNTLYEGVLTGSAFYDGNGKSTLASDPNWAKLLTWAQGMNAYYGQDQVKRFVAQYQPHSDDASNPFTSGKVAMEVDGEWHIGELADYAPKLDYGIVPVPKLAGSNASPGAGETAGTVMYLPTKAAHQQEAAFTIASMATDTEFLTDLATTMSNVPSTFDSLAAWKNATGDPHWAAMVAINKDPGSGYTPLTPAGAEIGTTFGTAIQSFDQSTGGQDAAALLASTAAKIDRLNAAAGN
jgi:multiple sugar transport system substrate-binding protein